MNDDITSLETSFQDGCSVIAAKITALGVTTSSTASPTTIANNIKTLATNKYNAGVSAADARVNTNSSSYTSGYNNGYNAGKTSATKTFNIQHQRWGAAVAINIVYNGTNVYSYSYDGTYDLVSKNITI